MRRQKSLSVVIKAPSRGLVSRLPGQLADQIPTSTGIMPMSAVRRASSVASNVRYEDGVVAAAPGYQRIKIVTPILDGLVAQWSMEESSGTRFDGSGNSHNLTDNPGFDVSLGTVIDISAVPGKVNSAAFFPAVGYMPVSTAAQSIITPATAAIIGDGVTIVVVTVQAVDQFGNNILTGGDTVHLSLSGLGSLSAVTDENTGKYIATYTAGAGVGTATITGTLNGVTIGTTSGFSSCVVTNLSTVSASHSTVSPSSTSVEGDGLSVALITVQARSASNTNLPYGGAVVVFTLASGTGTLGGAVDNGNGTYTCRLTSPAAVGGSGTVTATLNGVAVGTAVSATQCVVSYTALVVNASVSTVAIVTSGAVADGTATDQVKVIVLNVHGVPISGKTVSASVVGPASVSYPGGTTSDSNGVVLVNLTSTLANNNPAQNQIVSAIANSVSLTQTASVQFVPGVPSASVSTVAASTPSVANGTSFSTILVLVKDAHSNPVSGQLVTVSSSGSNNTISYPNGQISTASGSVVAHLLSTTQETKTITAVAGTTTLSTTPSVVFTAPADPAHSGLSPSTAEIPADGSSTQVITLTSRFATNLPFTSGGNAVIFSLSGPGALSGAVDNGDGTYNVTVTSGTIVGSSGTVTATMNGVAVGTLVAQSQATVQYGVLVPDAANSTVSATAVVAADGAAQATITVTVRDVNGAVMPGVLVHLQITAPFSFTTVNDPSPGSQTTDSAGRAIWLYSSTQAYTATGGLQKAAATAGGVSINQTALMQFTPGVPVVGHSAFSVTTPVTANGIATSNISVAPKDVNNNPVPGIFVTISSSRGATDTLSASSATTDGSGFANFTMTSHTTGTATVTVVDATDSFTFSPTHNVVFT